MIHSHTKDKDHTAKNIVLDRSRKLAIAASFVYFIYISVCIVAYVVVDDKFKNTEMKQEVEKWKANYKDNCHEELPLNSSLQNVVLYGCGYVTLTYGAYIFTIYRKRMLRYSSVPIQDYEALHYQGISFLIIGKVFIRLLLVIPVAALAISPFLLFDKENIGESPLGPLLILLTNIILPLFVSSAYMFTLYDKLAFWAYDLFGWNDF